MSLNTASELFEGEHDSWPQGDATGEVLLAYQREVTPKLKRRVVPMWVFASDELRLRCDKPVPIAFEYQDGGVLAECERLHIFVSRATPEDCLREIQHQVGHFFTFYTTREENEVAGLASELRRLYLKHFHVLSEE